MQALTQVATQLLRENWCITSKSTHSPVALKNPTQKGSACSALPQTPQSQSRGDSVARPWRKMT